MSNYDPEARVCAVCKTETENLSFEPSRSTLIFGPHPGSMYFGTQDNYTYEYRCPKCEAKLAKEIRKLIKSI